MINKIIVFFDYNCPFCYTGFSIIEELKSKYNIECEYKACEIFPYIPIEGIVKEECLKGCDIDYMYSQLRKIGKENNLEFGHLDNKYNSHKALMLAEFAQQNNIIPKFSKAIYEQYYKYDKNISDDNLLKKIYSDLNLNYEYATKEIENGNLQNVLKQNAELMNKYNVEIFPTYIINEESRLSGILNKNDFLEILDKYN